MSLSFSIVLPILLLMAFGYSMKRLGIVEESVFRGMNRFGMRCFLPVNLFYNIYQSDFAAVMRPRLLAYACGSVMVLYLLLCLIVPKVVKSPADRGSIIQGLYRSNYVLFGVTVVTAAYGADQAGIPSVLAAFVVPLYNMLAVLTFELFRGGRPKMKHLLSGIARNPLIGGSVLGILFQVLGLRIPAVLETAVAQVSSIAPPFLMVALGAALSFRDLKQFKKQLFWVVVIRLAVVPAAGLGLAYLLNFRGIELFTLLAVFGTPTAVSSYAMAEELGGNGPLSAQIVAATCVCSIVSLFLWTCILL